MFHPLFVQILHLFFLRHITGRPDPAQAGAATLAAEIYAALGGADYIRTHDVAALVDALKIVCAARANEIPGSKTAGA